MLSPHSREIYIKPCSARTIIGSSPQVSRTSNIHLTRQLFPLYHRTSYSTPLHSTPLHSTPLHSTPLHSTFLICHQQPGSIKGASSVSVRVGLTSSFIDKSFSNHDIEKIEILTDTTEFSNDEKSLISIDWSGYKPRVKTRFGDGVKNSHGEELDHTVWVSVKGKTLIKRPSEVPMGAKFGIDSFNFEMLDRAGMNLLPLTSQSEHWLYTVQVHPDTLECFLTKMQYENWCADNENVNNDGDTNPNHTTNDMEKLKMELHRRSKLAAHIKNQKQYETQFSKNAYPSGVLAL